MSAGVLRAWWSKVCSICFVVSIVLPTTAPFQVVAAGEVLRFGLQPRVTSPSRGVSTQVVTHQTGVPSWRGQEGRRHRTNSTARSRRTSTIDCAPIVTSITRNQPSLSRASDQQLTVLRI
jgi:hypothetical protein